MNKHYLFFLLLCGSVAAFGQPNFTANSYVKPYNAPFRYGANLGNYPPWSNLQVANIATGNAAQGQPGIHVNAYRGSLPEHFLEAFGYNIRLADYQHFQSLGATDNLAFIGYPSEAHRDPATFCDTIQSALFKNMYLPIWDGGANGTPVNDQNHYALYLYKMVSLYKNHIKFWEVWNEPDFTYNTNAAYAPPGAPGNWWDNDPNPCDYALMAPIEHYVRLLRISFEVIKTVDSTAYVAIGGIGNPAFLDAVLRNTDNPSGGGVATDFPLSGGAYFDALSFHSYPHLDGSMWEFPPTGGLFFHRHSDRGVEGMLARQTAMRQVLEAHGYDGGDFPKKHWVLSETNIPRKPFNVYIGSDEAQVNYIMKALTEAHKNDLKQLYLFNIADLSDEADAWNEFLLMGLFKNLSSYNYPNHDLNDAAFAWKTTADFFASRNFNPSLTASLNLPNSLNGAAFSGTDTLFVLWAKTSLDSSEAASGTYTFPASLELDTLRKWAWDFSMTKDTSLALANNVALTGTPIFLQRKPVEPMDTTVIIIGVDDTRLVGFEAACFPNPSSGSFTLKMDLPKQLEVAVRLLNTQGQLVEVLMKKQVLEKGTKAFFFEKNLPDGLYFLEIQAGGKEAVVEKLPLVISSK